MDTENIAVSNLHVFTTLIRWLQKGSLCRTTAATDMNQTSSRSHAIFSVILKQQRSEELEPAVEIDEDEEAGSPQPAPVPTGKSGDKPLKKLASKFHFVDLAGSERVNMQCVIEGRLLTIFRPRC